MKLSNLSTVLPFLLVVGVVQAFSFSLSLPRGKGLGHEMNLGSIAPLELFEAVAAQLPSPHISQAPAIFSAFRDEVKKVEQALQDSDLAAKIVEEFTLRTSKLQEQFQYSAFPDDSGTCQCKLEAIIDKVMDILDTVVKDVGNASGKDTDDIRRILQNARQPLKDIVCYIEKIIDDHPCLFELVMLLLAMNVPGSWLIRPILEVIGFSVQGPVKGSFAAWMQSKVYGANVPKGSWFSIMQKAGMLPNFLTRNLGTAITVAAILVHCNL